MKCRGLGSQPIELIKHEKTELQGRPSAVGWLPAGQQRRRPSARWIVLSRLDLNVHAVFTRVPEYLKTDREPRDRSRYLPMSRHRDGM
jgi:hypothetical protein